MSASLAHSEFGARLRETRKRLGLSQSELGGDRYSGSYISHLESGRRAASAEVIEFLAGRLGVEVEELGMVAAPPTALESVEDIQALDQYVVAQQEHKA